MRELIKEKTAHGIVSTNEVQAKEAGARSSVVLKKIVIDLHKFFQENGKQKAIIGISGGIDSAVCAYLCCKALGSDNVRGFAMPSKYSSKGSVIDAEKLADSLGFTLFEFPIKDLDRMYRNEFAHLFIANPLQTEEATQSGCDIAYENIQARIRGNILMSYANMIDGLVIETSNKTEALMGYCTLYGDTCGAISPLGDIYKTELYYLVKEFINKDYEIIPQDIVDKEPSAELRPDQEDKDDLPASYEVLDAILIAYYEENVKLHAIQRMMSAVLLDPGLPVNIINQTAKMSFKRRQSPPAINICHEF